MRSSAGSAQAGGVGFPKVWANARTTCLDVFTGFVACDVKWLLAILQL